MSQPQLVQLALDAQGHSTIGVDRDGGVWRGRIQRDKSGEEFIVWKRMRSEFPPDTPPKENRDERRTVRGYLHRPKLNSGERSSICTASAAGRSEREHRHRRELEAGAGGRATRAESPRRGAPWTSE